MRHWNNFKIDDSFIIKNKGLCVTIVFYKNDDLPAVGDTIDYENNLYKITDLDKVQQTIYFNDSKKFAFIIEKI
jgi:hypothetical protein